MGGSLHAVRRLGVRQIKPLRDKGACAEASTANGAKCGRANEIAHNVPQPPFPQSTVSAMPPDFNIETPADRKRALRGIVPEDATRHHELLRRIFAAEVEFRPGQDWDPAWGKDDNYFENVYWCAWLLFLVGDPADVPAMWRCKYEVNFDLGCGFDVENMLGASPARTVAWLQAHDMQEIADDLANWCEEDSSQELARWSAGRRRYFLGT